MVRIRKFSIKETGAGDIVLQSNHEMIRIDFADDIMNGLSKKELAAQLNRYTEIGLDDPIEYFNSGNPRTLDFHFDMQSIDAGVHATKAQFYVRSVSPAQ